MKEQQIQELYEIADGALGHNPMARGEAVRVLLENGLNYPDTREPQSRDPAPTLRKPHPGKDGEAMLDEIGRIANLPEAEVLALADAERLDIRLALATKIVEERSFYGDFHSDSPERAAQEALCKRMARAEGWRDAGLYFKHETQAAYLKSDMDGWRDLCSNEGILP